ncbi:MAG: DUF3048 domain-containing protein [Oscillospiraceae bacterium]|nr:DUF3048 domain-containing protein [Oscillospiraceae bacterium]
MKNKIFKKFLFITFLFFLIFAFASCKDDKKTTEAQNEITTDSEISGTIETEETIEDDTDYEEDDDFWDDEDDEEDDDDNLEGTTKKPKKEQVYPSNPTTYYSYLTGIKCTRKQQRKRPVSIIINNYRPAMPMVGISHADIIYECMVEGGITRFMMVLSDYENVPVFGSVRSSREYFIDLSRTHDTIYVHAGGNPQDYDQFDIRPIERMDGVNMHFPNTFYRDSERRKTMALEHTLMATGAGIVKGIEERNYRDTLNSDYKGAFKFNTEFTDIGGEDKIANYICVPYSNAFKPEFIYNPDDNLYYRKQFGEAHIDGETGEQIKFENIIVIFAEYAPFRGNAIAIREGHWSCKLTGTGYGFHITGGKYKVIKWKKETRESIMTLYNTDNTDLLLNPGKSFICVTSTIYNKSVVINSDIKSVN